jgi:YgiT-type zinc finger domain-containing protein
MGTKQEQCYLCGGVLLTQDVTKIQMWKGELIGVVERVPAMACNQCGEQYFDAQVLEDIDNLFAQKNSPSKNISIPSYTYRKTG